MPPPWARDLIYPAHTRSENYAKQRLSTQGENVPEYYGQNWRHSQPKPDQALSVGTRAPV